MKLATCSLILYQLIALPGCGSSGSSANYGAATSTSTSGRSSSSIGTSSGHLVDGSGYALYTTPSACTGSCLTVWPPLTASQAPSATGGASAGSIGLQSGQVTYKGELLYYFDQDTTAGETSGNGVGGFSLATP
jgi:predicted lipoprotein with Yx(FWY)xxD motif